MDLKTLRTSKRITQWDLRNKTGISQTKICLIERGYIEPRTEEKKKIATALGVKKDEINWQESIPACAAG